MLLSLIIDYFVNKEGSSISHLKCTFYQKMEDCHQLFVLDPQIIRTHLDPAIIIWCTYKIIPHLNKTKIINMGKNLTWLHTVSVIYFHMKSKFWIFHLPIKFYSNNSDDMTMSEPSCFWGRRVFYYSVFI